MLGGSYKPETTIEPSHDKTNKMIFVSSKDSDQTGRIFLLFAQWVAKGPSFLYANREDSDQTGRMPRLICFCWA